MIVRILALFRRKPVSHVHDSLPYRGWCHTVPMTYLPLDEI